MEPNLARHHTSCKAKKESRGKVKNQLSQSEKHSNVKQKLGEKRKLPSPERNDLKKVKPGTSRQTIPSSSFFRYHQNYINCRKCNNRFPSRQEFYRHLMQVSHV